MFWINLFSKVPKKKKNSNKSAQELDFQGLDVFSSLLTSVFFQGGRNSTCD